MAAPSWEDFVGQRGFTDFVDLPSGVKEQMQAEYLNTYGAEGIANLKAAGVSLPQTYVDPNEENLALYRSYFDEHVAEGAYKPEDWESFKTYFMGNEETPAQGGKWESGEGGLTFRPNVPQGSYRDTGSWLTNFTSALPAVGRSFYDPIGSAYDSLRTSHGIADVIDKLIEAPIGNLGNTGGNAIGAAIKDEPGLLTAVNVVGDAAAGILGAAYGPAIAAGVSGIKGKILGTPAEQNFLNALKTAGTSYALNQIGGAIGDYADMANLGDDALAIIADMDANAAYNAAVAAGQVPGAAAPGVLAGMGQGGMDYGLGAAAVAPGDIPAATGGGILDMLPSGADTGKVIDTAGNVLNFVSGAGGEALPPLPGLLTTDTSPEPELPELPERISLAMPEGMTFPDIAPYLPRNWDQMSLDEQEEWLVTRGGEISKRRRGTWAGNLSGIRGGKGAGLEFAELTGMTGGKQILGE